LGRTTLSFLKNQGVLGLDLEGLGAGRCLMAKSRRPLREPLLDGTGLLGPTTFDLIFFN